MRRSARVLLLALSLALPLAIGACADATAPRGDDPYNSDGTCRYGWNTSTGRCNDAP